MTRNEQPGFDPGLYDQDFYSWTQRQAEALRALPGQPSVDLAPLDIAHLAEEIEDLGKRDLREVVSNLRLVVQHLVKLQAAPGSRDAAHWHSEAVNFQLMARGTFSPSMRRLVEVDDIWTGGCRAAGRPEGPRRPRSLSRRLLLHARRPSCRRVRRGVGDRQDCGRAGSVVAGRVARRARNQPA